MSSTFELYEKLQKIIPKERIDNIENLKNSFDNILSVFTDNDIINKVSSDIDMFYKTKIKNFNLYESKCLKLDNIKEESKKQILFDKNDDLNKKIEIINYINDKNNLCIFDVSKNKLIKNLPDLSDIRIIHGFKYEKFITVTIDNYLNICVNYEKNDYKLSIYIYKNKVKYPLILFYNSKINYLDDKMFDYKNNNSKLNLLNEIILKINILLENEYSKDEIKARFNTIEKIIIDFFAYQEELKNYKVTRSMNLLINSYNFQLEYFNGMRILFESLKNHKFNIDYFNECNQLKNEKDKLTAKICELKEKSDFNNGKLLFFKNSLDKKELHCNKLIDKIGDLSEENVFLNKRNEELLNKVKQINKSYKFRFRFQFIVLLLLMILNLSIIFILFNELDDTSKIYKYYEYYLKMIENNIHSLNVYYNNFINSKFINETMGSYL